MRPSPDAGRSTKSQSAVGPALRPLLLGLLLWSCGAEASRAPRPNFLLILADDLGIGDLGCYGNHTLRTLNIDRLADEGLRLTQHLAAAPLCTPSRAAFLTGRYAIRSGMAGRGHRALQWNAGSGGLPPNETTFARVLRQQGYTTGLVGKWHQGLSCASRGDHCHHPLSHGFDYFYGVPFTLLSDCHPHGPPELAAATRAQLRSCTRLLALGALTLLAAKVHGLLPVPWKVVLGAACLSLLLFLCWSCSSGFVRRWNCIVMRNHEVTGQPMDLDRSTQLLLREAQAFIRR